MLAVARVRLSLAAIWLYSETPDWRRILRGDGALPG